MKLLGRKVTFKDLARRVVFTKLANNDEISAADAAKHMGVQKDTIMVYHQKGKETSDQAARILSALPKKQSLLEVQFFFIL